MDITGIGAIFNMGSKIIDKFWPDKAEAERIKIELFRMTQEGEFKELEADLERTRLQVQVNTAEAQSGSNFRGGWRPFIGWVCGVGLLYSVLFRPVASGIMQIWHPGFTMPETGGEELFTLLAGMLGLGSLRTFEKIKK